MRVTLIGDLHTRSTWFHSQYMPPNSIQVGDLCLWNYMETWQKNNMNRPDGWQNERRFFIEGNHENFPELMLDHSVPYAVSEGLWHIPRGFISGSTLFIGGGFSIDHWQRTPGCDWFPEEQLSQKQFEYIMHRAKKSITTVVAHDFPSFLYPHLNIYDIPSPHCHMLWEIYNRIQPTRWFGGHHHRAFDKKIGNCHFFILAEAQKREFDLDLDPDFFTASYNPLDEYER